MTSKMNSMHGIIQKTWGCLRQISNDHQVIQIVTVKMKCKTLFKGALFSKKVRNLIFTILMGNNMTSEVFIFSITG